MDARTKDIDLGWNRIQKELKLIDKSYTQIGIQKDAGNEDGGESIADVGASNEYGLGQVPERSFIRSTFDEKRFKIYNIIDKKYSLVLKGKSTVKRQLALLGEYMEGAIKRKITNLRSPPNSQVTIKIKGSANPLIDTGRMRASMRHVEVIKKK